MAFDVFLSYSSKDKTVADAACAVLESRGIRCWIAPRDIRPGADWGQSIIDAINGCQLMVLIFSTHANESQQVKREVERVVNRGRTIIPVRIEDVVPTRALEYFLSTPHWLDAFSPPLEAHLDHLAETVKLVLSQPTVAAVPPPIRSSKSAWMLAKPIGVSSAVLTALVLLAFIAFRGLGNDAGKQPVAANTPANEVVVPREAPPSPISTPGPVVSAPVPAVPVSPLLGRWQAEMTDDEGKKYDCQMDLKPHAAGGFAGASFLSVAFSDGCPFPFCAASGMAYFAEDGTWASSEFRPGKDTGTFTFQVGGLKDFAGTYRLEESTLRLSYANKGELLWKRIASEGPLPNSTKDVLAAQLEWPTKDVPGLVKRALEYVRKRWQKDAVLLRTEFKSKQVLGELAEVNCSFEFYSPKQQKGLQFEPDSKSGFQFSESEAGKKSTPAIPVQFLDLPESIDSLKERAPPAKMITSASLQYREYYDYRDVRGNNAILPPCP